MLTLPWPLGRRNIDEALAHLRDGALCVYPTETVFGLGVVLSAGDAGVARVRAAKGTQGERPFILLAGSPAMAYSLWTEVPPIALLLGTSVWPGPLTLVGPARPGLPQGVLGSVPGPDGPIATVSVRVPGDAALRQLIGRLEEPLLSTSANLAGGPAVTVRDELALDALAPDLFLEAPSCAGGVPSTVLTTLEDPPRILRAGAWRPTLLGEETE